MASQWPRPFLGIARGDSFASVKEAIDHVEPIESDSPSAAPPSDREHAERLARMMAWLEDPAPLEQLRRRMPPGSTLEDARRLHRLLAQEGRRFSKVMRDLTDELA